MEAGTAPSTGTYTIGTGTSSTAQYSPYKGYWHDSHSQYIFTAAELTTAGLSAGDPISSMAWNVNTKSSTQVYSSFEIKLAHTTSSTSSVYLTPTWTVCFSGDMTTTTGWNTHNFTTNFTWNGTDNIVIETCHDNTSFTGDDAVYYTSATGTCIMGYADNDAGCAVLKDVAGSSRANIQIGSNVTGVGYDITLAGDFDNSSIYTHMDGKVTFDGASIAQVIKGTTATTFYDFSVNNGAGITITKGPTVSNVIEFLNGDVTAADLSNKFTLGASATISSSFPADAASHVVGYCQVATTATTEREIPIGDGTLYRPAYTS